MTNKRDLPICKACRWYDMTQPQCFDGHLQRQHIKECEGYEYSEIPAQLAFKHQESHSELWEEMHELGKL